MLVTRGATPQDNFILSLLLLGATLLILSPYLSQSIASSVKEILGLPPYQPLPVWWGILSGVVLFLFFFLSLSTF